MLFRKPRDRSVRPRHQPAPGARSEGLRGLFDVLATTVLCTALLGVAGQYGTLLVDVGAERRARRGVELVADARDAISACSYEFLTTLRGTWFADPRSEGALRIDVDVSPAENGRLRIQAVLVDEASAQEKSRFVTFRGRT
jgi:hypothetical protein